MSGRALSVRGIVSNPLAHFLVVGLVLFGTFQLVGRTPSASTDTIVIDQYELSRLAALWQAQWRRPPTAEELSKLVDERVREELFFREALALGLDANDVLVRRRLAQKLELALKDVAAPSPPSVDELRRFYQRNAARYRADDVITLEHRFYSADGAQDAMSLAATAVHKQGDCVDDPFHAPKRLDRVSGSRVAQVFGDRFLSALIERAGTDGAVGAWFGPVQSAFGFHAVRVIDYRAGTTLAFADVREQVAREWRREQIAQAMRRRVQDMRARYRIDVASYASIGDLVAP